MTRKYYCPSCRAHLNPNRKIVLSVRQGEQHGLALLSPEPGNYEIIVSEDLDLEQGALLEIRCPVCAESLQSKASEFLACIEYENPGVATGCVDFSRRYGEHATYVITEHDVQPYGENAELYSGVNFFGAGSVMG